MSWTRLDDLWGDQIESTWPDDFALRWHYLKMIQHASKIKAWDGVLTRTAAERCSDHPDPGEAIGRLVNEQLVQDLGKKVKLTRIDEHIPPPHIRNQQETSAERQRRSRAHRNDDHSLCIPGDDDQPANCLHASSHRDVTSNVTRDTRTGQDRQGLKDVTEDLEENFDPETGELDSTSSPKNAPGPAELFGDAPVTYTPEAPTKEALSLSDETDEADASDAADAEQAPLASTASTASTSSTPSGGFTPADAPVTYTPEEEAPKSEEHDYTPEILRMLKERAAERSAV